MSLEVKHLTHTYSAGSAFQATAVHDVSLTIEDGEFVCIVGHTGSGKSTLVQHLNGLLKPSEGTILFNGENIWAQDYSRKTLRSKVGLVFQYPEHQLFETDVFADVCYGPKNLGLEQVEIERRAKKALELVGFPEKFFGQSPFELSGGQKQRVGIARAIVSNPSVLLSDEATSALDPETVKSILQLLKDINKKLGITIVMITHQMEVIKEIAQHVAVIEHGKIIEEGSVINLFTNPQTETLKKFVGSVMSSELPAQLSHMNIHPTKEHESDNILISLSFRGDVTNEPIIAQLIKKYNLNVSILYGSIDYIQDISFGRLLIMISGHLEDLTDALTHLNALPITSEVIGYVSRNN
jgi:D-methionine transport system ATP-binding protein